MKRFLLFAVASLLMVGAASAQPPQGPRGPQEFRGPQGHFFAPQGMHEFQMPGDFKAPEGFRAPKNFEAPKDFPGPRDFRGPRGPQGPHGFRPHPGNEEFVVVPLTDEEVAERFAHRLHLDSEKAAAFAPIFTAYRADVKVAEEENPVSFKPNVRRGPKAEQPTEAELTEMKAQHKQFVARDKAVRAVKEDYKENFCQVLNDREYHWLSHLERDRGMFVKFVRKQKNEEQNEQTAPTRGDEDIAAGIGAVVENDAAGTWFSLDGTKVIGQPTKSGVYVKDGKKVMVK